MITWRAVHVGFESDGLKISGEDVWNNAPRWRRVKGERLFLPHPAHPKQLHQYDVYEFGSAGSPVRFATSELSNGVWGFYVPDTADIGRVRFRASSTSDVEALADMRWRLKTEDRMDEDWEPRVRFAQDFCAWYAECDQTAVTHWVAELDGRLLAVMTLITVRKVPGPDALDGRWGYLTNCYALPEARDLGIGARLLEWVKERAASAGLEMLVVWPSERSFSFYERAEFRREPDPLVLDLKR